MENVGSFYSTLTFVERYFHKSTLRLQNKVPKGKYTLIRVRGVSNRGSRLNLQLIYEANLREISFASS